ncbi:MAG: ANTAR domain-containing protein [Peptococcaceae bacterium]|nr:ANTAR domain-containing protein [Peptococcaceae bacterium]
MSGETIVLVERDLSWRKKIKSMISKAGYKVIATSGDGISALKTIRIRQPDLVVLDVEFPGIDGVDVAKIICQDNIAPVVALTSSRSVQLMQKAKEARVAALLNKPVDEGDLLFSIELALANFQDKISMQSKIRELKDAISERKFIEKAKGILMETLGCSEKEAFKKIQKQSMNNRISMEQVAKAVIMMEKLKGS